MKGVLAWVGPICVGVGLGDWLRNGLRTGAWLDLGFPLIMVALGIALYYASRSLARSAASDDTW